MLLHDGRVHKKQIKGSVPTQLFSVRCASEADVALTSVLGQGCVKTWQDAAEANRTNGKGVEYEDHDLQATWWSL